MSIHYKENTSHEESPLLSPSSSDTSFCGDENCCRKQPKKNNSTYLQMPTDDNDDPSCQLSNQPWKYKLIALLCAMFLASKTTLNILLR